LTSDPYPTEIVEDPAPVHAVTGTPFGTWHSVSTTVPPAGIWKLATDVATLEAPIPTKMVLAPELVTTRSRRYPEALVVYTVPAVVVTAVLATFQLAAIATRSFFLAR
jgi:hypothetical protein